MTIRGCTIPALVFLSALLIASSSVQAANRISLPNDMLIGSRMDHTASIYNKLTIDSSAVIPEQVQFDLRDGKVTGIIFTYSKKVPFEDVQNAVDRLYGDWVRFECKQNMIKAWFITPLRFAIQLTRNKDGTVKLLYSMRLSIKS